MPSSLCLPTSTTPSDRPPRTPVRSPPSSLPPRRTLPLSISLFHPFCLLSLLAMPVFATLPLPRLPPNSSPLPPSLSPLSRRHRRPERPPYHQRAHRRGHRLRPGQEGRREDRAHLRLGRRYVCRQPLPPSRPPSLPPSVRLVSLSSAAPFPSSSHLPFLLPPPPLPPFTQAPLMCLC